MLIRPDRTFLRVLNEKSGDVDAVLELRVKHNYALFHDVLAKIK